MPAGNIVAPLPYDRTAAFGRSVRRSARLLEVEREADGICADSPDRDSLSQKVAVTRDIDDWEHGQDDVQRRGQQKLRHCQDTKPVGRWLPLARNPTSGNGEEHEVREAVENAHAALSTGTQCLCSLTLTTMLASTLTIAQTPMNTITTRPTEVRHRGCRRANQLGMRVYSSPATIGMRVVAVNRTPELATVRKLTAMTANGIEDGHRSGVTCPKRNACGTRPNEVDPVRWHQRSEQQMYRG